MGKKPIAQLWLKPGAFGRHYQATIGYGKQLFYAYGVKTYSQFHFPVVYPAL